MPRTSVQLVSALFSPCATERTRRRCIMAQHLRGPITFTGLALNGSSCTFHLLKFPLPSLNSCVFVLFCIYIYFLKPTLTFVNHFIYSILVVFVRSRSDCFLGAKKHTHKSIFVHAPVSLNRAKKKGKKKNKFALQER